MIVLALDTATTTGFCHGEIGGTPQWGTFKAKGDELGEKASRFRYWLMAMVGEVRPDWIVYEAPYIPVGRAPRFVKAGTEIGTAIGKGAPPMNPATLEMLLALTGIVQEVAFERAVKCRKATVLEITRHFTGTVRHGGRDNKKSATIEACRRLGWDTVSDDAADALALFSLAEKTLDPVASSRRWAGASLELPLHGLRQDRIGRRAVS